jgi:hypothetical protein
LERKWINQIYPLSYEKDRLTDLENGRTSSKWRLDQCKKPMDVLAKIIHGM